MKKWNDPKLTDLKLKATNELVACSINDEIETYDGHHSTKCHHGLEGVNPSNCPYFTRPGGMCSYPGDPS